MNLRAKSEHIVTKISMNRIQSPYTNPIGDQSTTTNQTNKANMSNGYL
jgi:hypothetical protein